MNKYRITDIGGSITKEDDRYKVCDNSALNNLVLSSTDLKPKKSTSGHITCTVEDTDVLEEKIKEFKSII